MNKEDINKCLVNHKLIVIYNLCNFSIGQTTLRKNAKFLFLLHNHTLHFIMLSAAKIVINILASIPN